MSIKINTKDSKQFILNNIIPYTKIKLLTDLLYSLNDNEENENNNENENEENENEENENKTLNNFNLKEDYEIELDINYNILEKIFEYADYTFKIKELNITDQDKFNYINNFLDCKKDDLCDLLNACYYLQYDDLVDIICDKIADDIEKCDSVESITKLFNINKIISKEEEEEILSVLT